MLDAWLEDVDGSTRFVLAAPAGRGKSALLVRWIKRLESTGRIGQPDTWQLAFVPISLRFNTNRPQVFYEALAARLSNILGQALNAAQTDPVAYYQDKCRELVTELFQTKKLVLIVIDGLDEAMGDAFDASWFPRGVGASIRLLVSARTQFDASDARGWIERLGWYSNVRVSYHDLKILNIEGIRDLLIKMGAPVNVLAARPEIVDKLYALAEGEPLVLRLYAEDLWRLGTETSGLKVEDLARLAPGLPSYFNDWLRRQRDLWHAEGRQIDEAAAHAYLAVLACAYGSLTSEQLGELVGRAHGIAPGYRTEHSLEPIRRFVIRAAVQSRNEHAGYVSSHPKFSDFLRSYFDRNVIERTRNAFAAWGINSLRQVNRGNSAPLHIPRYLITYLGQHLEDVNYEASGLMGFVEEGKAYARGKSWKEVIWLRARRAKSLRDGGPPRYS